MKKQEDIERQAERALNSLNNVQPVEANEFLYTRIKNRMEQGEAMAIMHRKRVLLRLAAVLIFFVGINFTSFYLLNKPATKQDTKPEAGIEAFAQAYGLNTNSDSY